MLEMNCMYNCYSYCLNNPLMLKDPTGLVYIPYDQTVSTYTRIGRGFGANDGKHQGQDISAKEGTSVHSFASGKVVEVAYSSSWGNYVVVDHGDNYFSLYAHLQDNSTIVKKDDILSDGQQIVAVGNTGRSDGAHLHLEVGQANSLKAFLSKTNRSETRTDPVEIGDLEKYLHPSTKTESNTNTTQSQDQNKDTKKNTNTGLKSKIWQFYDKIHKGMSDFMNNAAMNGMFN